MLGSGVLSIDNFDLTKTNWNSFYSKCAVKYRPLMTIQKKDKLPEQAPSRNTRVVSASFDQFQRIRDKKEEKFISLNHRSYHFCVFLLLWYSQSPYSGVYILIVMIENQSLLTSDTLHNYT